MWGSGLCEYGAAGVYGSGAAGLCEYGAAGLCEYGAAGLCECGAAVWESGAAGLCECGAAGVYGSGAAGLCECGAAGLCECGAAGLCEYGAAGLCECGAAGLQGSTTTYHRDKTAYKLCGHLVALDLTRSQMLRDAVHTFEHFNGQQNAVGLLVTLGVHSYLLEYGCDLRRGLELNSGPRTFASRVVKLQIINLDHV